MLNLLGAIGELLPFDKCHLKFGMCEQLLLENRAARMTYFVKTERHRNVMD